MTQNFSKEKSDTWKRPIANQVIEYIEYMDQDPPLDPEESSDSCSSMDQTSEDLCTQYTERQRTRWNQQRMRWNMIHAASVPLRLITQTKEVNDRNCKTMYGYGLPMSRATHCSWSAISDPGILQGLEWICRRWEIFHAKGSWL